MREQFRLKATWFLLGTGFASAIWWIAIKGLYEQIAQMLRGFI